MSTSVSPPQHDLRVLAPSFTKFSPLILLTVLLSFLASAFEGLSITMLIPFLQTFSEGSEPFRTGYEWVDQTLLGSNASSIGQMYRICALILVATWMRSVFGYFSSVYATISRARIVEDIRMRVVDQLRRVSMAFFTKTRGGDLLNSIMNEIGRTTTSLGIFFTVVSEGTMLLIYLSLMLWISWELTLVVLFFFGLLSFGLTWLIRSVRAYGAEITENSARFTGAISEFINGIRTVIAYNRQDHERERLAEACEDFADSVIASTKRRSLIKPLSQAVVGTVLIVLVVFAVQRYVLSGELDIAYILAFLFALFRMMPTIHNLNNQRGEWAQNRAGLTNVADLLRTEDKPYLADGPRPVTPLTEAITFDTVTFGYDPGVPVLKNVSCSFQRGKMTALVGASGAGKSTLADLLPRFYDPTEGRILFDDIDLRELNTGALREQIAIVSQHTHVFNDTVAANIAYGKLGATMDEIRTVARQANALHFIDEMENGFDTVLGDRGVRLSGGQKQRIAIARALLKDPDILILDEATSALDSISERLVQQSLDRLMEGRTVIAIAHRLSTIQNADWVIVLENGEIVEQGTYDALLHDRGQFWNYHSIQFQAA